MQGELAALAVWGVVLQFSTDDGFTADKLFQSTLPVLAKRSHHPPLHKEGRFAVCWGTDSSLYQREPCYSFGLKCWFVAKQAYQKKPILWIAYILPSCQWEPYFSLDLKYQPITKYRIIIGGRFNRKFQFALTLSKIIKNPTWQKGNLQIPPYCVL